MLSGTIDNDTAATARSELFKLGKRAVPVFIRILSSDNEATLKGAVETLGNMEQNAIEAVAELEQLREKQPSLQSAINDALNKIRRQ